MSEPVRRTVLRAYQTVYPDPLVLRAGDLLRSEPRDSEWSGWIWCKTAEGRYGWIPERYVDQQGSLYTMLRDYSTAELTVAAGDELEILDTESGWHWCRAASGALGWVPVENFEPEPESRS